MVMPDCSLVVTTFSRHSGPLQRTATRVTSMVTFCSLKNPASSVYAGFMPAFAPAVVLGHASAAYLGLATRSIRPLPRPNRPRHRPLTTAPNRHVLGELLSKPAGNM